jgi:hypothetical protein
MMKRAVVMPGELDYLQIVLTGAERVLGPDHPNTLTSRNKLGLLPDHERQQPCIDPLPARLVSAQTSQRGLPCAVGPGDAPHPQAGPMRGCLTTPSASSPASYHGQLGQSED